MSLATHNPLPGEPGDLDKPEDPDAPESGMPDETDAKADAQRARGAPGSFDQPEPHPEVMPREGGPRPKQTAEVPLGTQGHPEPPGARGHNAAPVQRKEGEGNDE